MAENYTRTWREQFALQKYEPTIWGDKGSELFHASDVLNAVFQEAKARYDADPMNYHRPVFSMKPIYNLRLISLVYYLRALGIENFLKGILVAREQEPTKGHKLRVLATKAGMPMTNREGVLFDELTAAVTWYGRYHIPLSQDQMTPRIALRDFPSIPGALDEREQNEVIALAQRVVQSYNEAIKQFEPIRAKRAKRNGN